MMAAAKSVAATEKRLCIAFSKKGLTAGDAAALRCINSIKRGLKEAMHLLWEAA